jgi:hypothetical protein
MTVPAGCHLNLARCSVCQSPLTGASLSDELFGGKLEKAAPVSSKPQSKPQSAVPVRVILDAVRASVLWGVLGGLAGGVVTAAITLPLFEDATTIRGATDFGVLMGFLLGSVWGAMASLRPESLQAGLIGGGIGLVETLVHHFGEWLLVAEPDTPAYLFGIMGFAAGAVTAVAAAWYLGYRDEA